MVGPSPTTAERSFAGRLARPVLALAVVAIVALAFAPSAAFAGQAASGELFFYPCSDCHPVTKAPGAERPSKTLPGDFKGHEIVLEGHDVLGKDRAACQTCHEPGSADPGKLKLADGSLVDITGDVAKVCYQCHSDKYKEWEDGTHGKGQAKCSAAGCHDPHTPGWIHAEALFPFVGSGFTFRVLPEREPFMPLMPPPPAPPSSAPAWFVTMAVLGVAGASGLVIRLVRGRQKR